MTTFEREASNPAPRLGRLLLAITAELRPVDVGAVEARLEGLAAPIRRRVTPRLPEDGAEVIVELLRRERLRAAEPRWPDGVLLDAVLKAREGHPLVIASLCAEAGGRAGVPAAPLRVGDRVLVGVQGRGRAVAVDPAGDCSPPAQPAAWLCAHEVAFLVLGELSRLLELHGRIPQAIHVARLRSALPVSGPFAERVEREVAGLAARLN